MCRLRHKTVLALERAEMTVERTRLVSCGGFDSFAHELARTHFMRFHTIEKIFAFFKNRFLQNCNLFSAHFLLKQSKKLRFFKNRFFANCKKFCAHKFSRIHFTRLCTTAKFPRVPILENHLTNFVFPCLGIIVTILPAFFKKLHSAQFRFIALCSAVSLVKLHLQMLYCVRFAEKRAFGLH